MFIHSVVATIKTFQLAAEKLVKGDLSDMLCPGKTSLSIFQDVYLMLLCIDVITHLNNDEFNRN